MKILFTGFTSRTIGSDRNQYDYMSNVFVLEQALKLAGHQVDVRQVSLMEDVEIEKDYDCALVGIAACQGLSSRFKLGACWTLHKFGRRAGIFPSDGKNIAVFPSSVLTCLQGEHKLDGQKIDSIDYFLGDLQREKNNVVDTELGHEMKDVWRDVLRQLPHRPGKPQCAWPMLVPTHPWGDVAIYGRHFGTTATGWDPTNVAIPMQFYIDELDADGRLKLATQTPERSREWLLTSLQDQSNWLKKVKATWPVTVIGNKRAARNGLALEYVPEKQLIDEYYTKAWGHLAFGYPLAAGGWWRMRFIHAALAGCVTWTDDENAQRMPEAYRNSRVLLERWSDDRLAKTAADQWSQLKAASWSADQAVETVDRFVKGLTDDIPATAD